MTRRIDICTPADSVDIPALIACILQQDANLTAQAVWQFLHELLAPGVLLRLLPITANIQRALAEGARADPDFATRRVAAWVRVTAAIMEAANEIAASVGPHVVWPEGAQENDLVGVLAESHPVYASAGSIPRDQSLRQPHALALYHLLVGHAQAVSEFVSLELYRATASPSPHAEFPNDVYPAALALRKLCGNQSGAALAAARMHGPTDRWVSSRLLGDEGETPEELTAIQTWVARALGIEPWSGRTGRGGGGGHAWQPGYVDAWTLRDVVEFGTEVDTDDSASRISAFLGIGAPNHAAGRVWARHLFEYGEDPAEHLAPERLTLNALGEKLTNYRPGDEIAVHGLNRRAAIQNQDLPWSRENLTATEIRRTIAAAKAAFYRNVCLGTARGTVAAEAAIAIIVMLSLSQSLQQISSLSVAREAGLSTGRLTFVDTGSHACWQLKAANTRYEAGDGDYTGDTRALSDYLLLPDPIGVASMVRKLMQHANAERGLRVFTTSKARLSEEINAQLQAILPGNGKRISQARLQRALYASITSRYGVVMAYHVTGRIDVTAAGRIFYYAHSEDHLVRVYSECAGTILGLSEDENMAARRHVEALRRHPPKHIGARHCATLGYTKERISKLRDALSKDPRQGPNQEAVAYHNRYTLYAILTLFYATGYRAVNDVSSPDIDQIAGRNLLVIRDKDVASGRMTRLAVIPDCVIEQIAHYQAHAEAVISSRMEAMPLARRPDPWPFAFVDGDWRPQSYSVGLFQRHLREFIDLPANQHRKFAANWLADNGIHFELLDAYMGHAADAQGPFDYLSTYDPVAHRVELSIAIERLLADIGLIPLVSKFVSPC